MNCTFTARHATRVPRGAIEDFGHLLALTAVVYREYDAPSRLVRTSSPPTRTLATTTSRRVRWRPDARLAEGSDNPARTYETRGRRPQRKQANGGVATPALS